MSSPSTPVIRTPQFDAEPLGVLFAPGILGQVQIAAEAHVPATLAHIDVLRVVRNALSGAMVQIGDRVFELALDADKEYFNAKDPKSRYWRSCQAAADERAAGRVPLVPAVDILERTFRFTERYDCSAPVLAVHLSVTTFAPAGSNQVLAAEAACNAVIDYRRAVRSEIARLRDAENGQTHTASSRAVPRRPLLCTKAASFVATRNWRTVNPSRVRRGFESHRWSMDAAGSPDGVSLGRPARAILVAEHHQTEQDHDGVEAAGKRPASANRRGAVLECAVLRDIKLGTMSHVG
ncbi:hypothetical protein FA09DRAFT_347255 [Tilletiopsis washingtonensis]|uniref:Uncharacterized protein n=1 Tax=Tilletiopsis washingtonensis TaxID=58919 RepID=A0A316Z0J1_9BASI|nr:hypothetical protein FA09DRAFT_347255 [Tilletiopsis washingtonensis]PWN95039.1 hypothetical protein FA09DRAFT_347255 [Tilletiopsis washingtonensis]